MTSLIAFAWRKSLHYPSSASLARPTDLQPSTSQDSQNVFHDNIGISSSSSGETRSCQPCTDSLFKEVATLAPSLLRGPYTPEGLKLRKTPQQIRQELGIRPKRLYGGGKSGAEAFHHPIISAPILPPLMPTVHGPLSPQISAASFYPTADESLVDNFARSPSLRPGEARTAVGALLARNEDIKPRFLHSHPIGSVLQTESSILPSREWLRDDRSVDEASDFSIELPYETLNESQLSLAMHSRGCSEVDSVDGSSIHSLPANLPDTSFTRGFLDHVTKGSYDFEPLQIDQQEPHPAEEIASADISYMSRSTSKDNESVDSMGYGNRNRADLQGDNINNYLERRETEYLILSILERLRDDGEFVSDILNAIDGDRILIDSAAVSYRDGMLSGFSPALLDRIVKALDSRLKRKAPSSRKYQILAFCRSLAQNAQCPSVLTVSTTQRYRWQVLPGVRAAIRLHDDPKSPETLRGGDTSLFSLPSESGRDATPHTSNVSMTSTITTAVSPNRNRYHGVDACAGEGLRQTAEILCITLSALGDECKKLAHLKNSDSIEANKAVMAITNIYKQLMELPNDELKVLIDSFELEVLDASITRIVSEDYDDEPSRDHSSLVPSWNQQGVCQMSALSIQPVPYGILEEAPGEAQTEEPDNPNLFSPGTQDMLSIDMVTTPLSTADTIDEDLRRTVGSFDNEDDVEGRDGPPALELQRQAMRGKQTTKRPGLFGRRPFRMRQAAE